MDEMQELTAQWYAAECRAKYGQDDRDKMAKGGQAMSDGSYPIGDADDLGNAIKAVGRGGADHDSIRRHIIKRAAALGLSDRIPDNWNADGSMRVEDDTSVEQRADGADDGDGAQCSTCKGDGKIRGGKMKCPDCGGTGKASSDDEANAADAPPEHRRLSHTIAYRKARMPRRGEREVRTLPLDELEVRDADERAADPTDEAGRPLLHFTGYASLFDRRYSVGPYEETISPGAFKRALGMANLDTVLRVEHGDLPLARTTGSVKLADGSEQPTLKLTEDAHGLKVDALLDPTDPDVQRLVPKFRRGDLREMSFAFRCENDVWSDDYAVRTIKTANIHRGDVAIVTYGASPMTSGQLRSESAVTELRTAGFGTFLDAILEWRDYTLLGDEERAGRAISGANMSFLQEMLSLFASADEAVDEGQARLSDFLGVPNPDTDDDDDDTDGDDGARTQPDGSVRTEDEPERAVPALVIPRRYAELEAELRMLARGRR